MDDNNQTLILVGILVPGCIVILSLSATILCLIIAIVRMIKKRQSKVIPSTSEVFDRCYTVKQ